MTTALTRRHLLQATSIGAGALAGASLLPRGAFAADEVVAAAYPGSFEESYAEVLVPLFRDATGAEVILTPLLAMEQVAKITASRGNPPLDVALLDEGPMLQSLSLDIFEPFPAEKAGTTPTCWRLSRASSGGRRSRCS